MLVAMFFVVGSLTTVVIADDLMAQDQVQLSAVQQQIAAASNTHSQLQLGVSEDEAPPVVVGQAENQLGMVSPGVITDLPQVPLNVPLPVPDTTPLPTS